MICSVLRFSHGLRFCGGFLPLTLTQPSSRGLGEYSRVLRFRPKDLYDANTLRRWAALTESEGLIMPRMIIKGQRNDLVWSQMLTPGMLIVTDCDCLEVVAAEVVETASVHYGETVERVELIVANIDGGTFERVYPMDHLVPTVPRVSLAA